MAVVFEFDGCVDADLGGEFVVLNPAPGNRGMMASHAPGRFWRYFLYRSISRNAPAVRPPAR